MTDTPTNPEGKPEDKQEVKTSVVPAQVIPDGMTNQGNQGTPAAEDKPKEEPKVDEKPKEEPKPEDKPKEEPKKEDGDDKALDTETWGTTGDAVGDSVLQLLQNANMSTDDAKALFADAAKELDITKVDKAKVVEKIGAAKAELVMAGLENFISRQKDQNAAVLNTLHTEAGTKEAWDQIAEWAKANVPESERLEYAELINAGGKQAKFAVSDLKARFTAAGNTDPVDTTVTPSAAATAPTVEPLTQRAYFEKLEALERSGKATQITRDALWKARSLGKSKGI